MNPLPPPPPSADLSQCDREPVQFIAGIQSTGYFIAFRPDDGRITNVSANVGERFTGDATEITGRRLEQVLPSDLMMRLRGAIGKSTLTTSKQSEFIESFFSFHGRLGKEAEPDLYDCYLYPSQGLVCLEFEAQNRAIDSARLQTDMCESLVAMNGRASFAEAARVLASGIRRLTGMDRVMVYRFLPRVWHGEVVAEDRVASSHAFLDHRFPASDIPRPARDLYLRNRLRFIQDARATSVPIVPAENGLTGQTLDLSDSRLRAVAPIHLEYLRNMGVLSSFSTAIVVEEKLWGLVACHHFEPLHLPYAVREACEGLTASFAGRVHAEENLKLREAESRTLGQLQNFLLGLRDSLTPVEDLFKRSEELGRIFRSQGLALVHRDEVEIGGLTPPKEEIRAIAQLAVTSMNRHNENFWVTDKIAALKPEWVLFKMAASGVLAIRVPGPIETIFLLFRPESLQTIQWGGDPRKSLQKRDYQGPINPRRSFESWNEVIEATSIEWLDVEVRGARFLADLIFYTYLEKSRLMAELVEKTHGHLRV